MSTRKTDIGARIVMPLTSLKRFNPAESTVIARLAFPRLATHLSRSHREGQQVPWIRAWTMCLQTVSAFESDSGPQKRSAASGANRIWCNNIEIVRKKAGYLASRPLVS